MTKLERQLAEALIWATGSSEIAEAGGFKKLVVPALNNYFAKVKQHKKRVNAIR